MRRQPGFRTQTSMHLTLGWQYSVDPGCGATRFREEETSCTTRCGDSGAAYGAARLGLHVVHATVGESNDGVDRGAVIGRSGNANAGADTKFQAVLHAEAGVHQRSQQIIGMGEAFLCRGGRHKDHKLIASITEAEVLLPAE